MDDLLIVMIWIVILAGLMVIIEGVAKVITLIIVYIWSNTDVENGRSINKDGRAASSYRIGRDSKE